MKSLRTLLREADPVEREPALTPGEIGRMRRRVLDAGRMARSGGWGPRLAVATAVVLVLALAGATGKQWRPDLQPARAPQPGHVDPIRDDVAAMPAIDARRQLQFATPGGTRVVWVFDSTFDER
jgi:hypothetical protein